MRTVRDRLSVRNERIKLFAGFWNAIGIGLIGFALLRPAVEDVVLISTVSLAWAGGGIVCHAFAHYVLGHLSKEVSDDDL